MDRRWSLLTFLGLIVGLAASAPAQAADSKTMSPAHCIITAGAGFPGGSIDQFGWVKSTSTTATVDLICPLDRDDPRAPPLSVVIGVLDTSTAGDISCTLLHSDRFGTATTFGGWRATTGVNLRGSVLTLPIPTTHFALGTYVVKCVLPRNSSTKRVAIASITISEVNAGN